MNKIDNNNNRYLLDSYSISGTTITHIPFNSPITCEAKQYCYFNFTDEKTGRDSLSKFPKPHSFRAGKRKV